VSKHAERRGRLTARPELRRLLYAGQPKTALDRAKELAETPPWNALFRRELPRTANTKILLKVHGTFI